MPSIELRHQCCMEYMRGLPDKAFDLAIVDPPYGIETRGNAQDRFRMGHDLSRVNDAKPTPEYFKELRRISDNQIIWGYNHLSDLLPSCREFIFWYKHQPVVTFSDGELAWTSFQKTARCFDFSFNKAIQEPGDKIHPTQKPVALYRWLLQNYAKPGQRILDTHGGSMSIAIACDIEGYDLTLCELDKDYFEAGKKRLEQHQQQPRMFAPEPIAQAEQLTIEAE